MNVFSSKDLLLSKWTSNAAFHDETHFVVTGTLTDGKGEISRVVLQGVHNRHTFELERETLEDSDLWRMGWR
ncbi:TIGR02450 family Trp-rich protein [Ferrimonas balearica]|uniref:TIGR02450 family Trp-rich protein n=1 Tax=Ferrimonas balearica TaxID=44012 RepID=UPI001C98F935|nr:TIGR02450 family Trp-rich protein [Ferrimonas balearica]MBY5992023.1 TIGR02450 family Trp-rich protein [Ferrimonas balearica]